MWEGPGGHPGRGKPAAQTLAGRQADSLAVKSVEAVYEKKSEGIGVRGRMEEQGRATGSGAPGVCVGKAPLAAGEGLLW